jgi:hypothetical protein
MLSKIVQESVSKRMSNIENTYYQSGMPENFLKTQQIKDIKALLIASQISLLEAELERKKGMMKELKGLESRVGDYFVQHGKNQAIQEDITYLQEQIEECRKLLK